MIQKMAAGEKAAKESQASSSKEAPLPEGLAEACRKDKLYHEKLKAQERSQRGSASASRDSAASAIKKMGAAAWGEKTDWRNRVNEEAAKPAEMSGIEKVRSERRARHAPALLDTNCKKKDQTLIRKSSQVRASTT